QHPPRATAACGGGHPRRCRCCSRWARYTSSLGPRLLQPFRTTTMANIAILGTGLLGGAFAEADAKRGDTVVAWNRSPDKVLALAQFGVKVATTPADAVQGASRVHIVLKD